MKRAILYARVSSDLQKKEKTIDSQIAALKKQITDAGCVLVEEYIDEGFSGAILDRPAMNKLRDDIKTNKFDCIYFLNTDRIAREVTYQTIIIAEILKYKKQIIINGKDYVHNPENKFTLTVLGAVAELERAKIIERMMRAKQHRIANGVLSGNGCNVYGYDHHRRTAESEPKYTINEVEAEVVRWVFETYAQGDIGMYRICQRLEERNAPTKYGRGLWRISLIKVMFKNEMYIGTRWYNMLKKKKLYGEDHKTKIVKRDRSEWVGVPVPPIISKELFDKVQERINHNRKKYRNPRVPQMLSSLVRCGSCSGSVFANRRYYLDKRMTVPKAYHKLSYQCNYKFAKYMHAKKNRGVMRPCNNIAIKGSVLEAKVFEMIETNLFDVHKLKDHMHYFKRRARASETRFEKQIKDSDEKIRKTELAKERLIDIYTSGAIDRSQYVDKSLELDNQINILKLEKIELLKKIPLLHKKELVDIAVQKFCAEAKANYGRCNSFDTRRQFLLDYTDKIVYHNDKAEYHGKVPVSVEADGKTETSSIEYCFKCIIPYSDRLKKTKGSTHGSVPISRGEYDLSVSDTIELQN